MEEEKGGNGLAIVFAFFMGGLVGAALSLLLAPASGRETREKIRDVSIDAKDKTVEAAQKAKERVASLVDQGKERAAGLVDQGREKIYEATDGVKAAVEAGKTAFVEKKAELTDAISHIKTGRKGDEAAEPSTEETTS